MLLEQGAERREIFYTLGLVLSHSLVSDSFATLGLQHSKILCPWEFSGKNAGVGCHFLLQGFFLTQGSNLQLLCLLHYGQMLYPLNHQGRPLSWWWECKLMQPLWRTMQKFLKKLKIELIAIPLLGINPEKNSLKEYTRPTVQHCLQLPRHGHNLSVH